MSRPKRPTLGRGLGALIPAPAPTPAPAAAKGATADPSAVRTLPIEELTPGPDQPRKRFEEKALAQLAESIKANGIIQPIVVTPAPAGSGARYFIVAGERRWRAAQRAALHDVPVAVRKTEGAERLELALVENIQRADLNPIEEAQAFAQLVELRGYTQDTLADRVGKDRSTISNALRLLRLPEKVQSMVRDSELSMGHARALLGLAEDRDMTDVARRVVSGKLSVRATEQLVRKRLVPTPLPDDETERRQIIVGELETRLRRRLGVRARLRGKRGSNAAGTLEIPYSDLDELDRVLQVILGEAM
ncbi:MAG: ParB/RepB/Spo0J family partition protein [Nannocystaceae bacterium]|nr:ParB/RepB/Spo0J family partition protein [Nannocystaceae bacterium]